MVYYKAVLNSTAFKQTSVLRMNSGVKKMYRGNLTPDSKRTVKRMIKQKYNSDAYIIY